VTLKRIIDPETYANHLSEIKVPQLVKAEIIDACLSPEDHINKMLDRRLKMDKNSYRAYYNEVERRAAIIEEKRSAAQTVRNAENEEINKVHNEPFARFTRAFNSLDPSALADFLANEPAENLASLHKQISMNPRHFNSILKYHAATAMQNLQSELDRRPEPQPVNLLTKIKNGLGL